MTRPRPCGRPPGPRPGASPSRPPRPPRRTGPPPRARRPAPAGEASGNAESRELLLVLLSVLVVLNSSGDVKRVFGPFGTQKLVRGCHPNNSTSTVARGLSNRRATAHSATLHGWLSATGAFGMGDATGSSSSAADLAEGQPRAPREIPWLAHFQPETRGTVSSPSRCLQVL